MNTTFKGFLKAVATPFLPLLRALGFLTTLTGLKHYRTYRDQAREFERLGGRITHRFPILTDYTQGAVNAASGYFHRDLLVASYFFERRPQRHIDVGSRVDGFVAHVAAFREIDSARGVVRDCRPTDIKMSSPYGLGIYTFGKKTA
jgi:hypothetical protein